MNKFILTTSLIQLEDDTLIPCGGVVGNDVEGDVVVLLEPRATSLAEFLGLRISRLPLIASRLHVPTMTMSQRPSHRALA